MECSDDLFKIDTQVEGVTFKILHILEDISGSSDLAVVTKAGAQGVYLGLRCASGHGAAVLACLDVGSEHKLSKKTKK